MKPELAEFFAWAQLAMSFAVFPLIKILWGIKLELAPLVGMIKDLKARVERVERWQDSERRQEPR